jgi:hypothetical protein
MKKQKKFSGLSFLEMCTKQDELAKELVTFNVSMDASAIKSSNGLVNLKRDLKEVTRLKSILAKSAKGTA